MDIKGVEIANHDSDIAPTRRRLEWNTYFVLAIMVFGSWLVGNLRLVEGVGLGGILGLVNYRWLSSSLGVIIGGAAENHSVPRWTVLKFILRYLVVGTAMGLAVWSGRFDLLGIVFGFCALVGAFMLEAGYQIYLMIFHQEEFSK